MAKRILGILSYVGMALVFGALAVRLLGRNEYITVSTQAEQYLFYAAITGLALVLVYVIGSMDFRRQQTRQGTLAGVGVIVFLGILVAVNYLSTRRNTRWDLTANKQYSLSEQTVKLLRFGASAELRAAVPGERPKTLLWPVPGGHPGRGFGFTRRVRTELRTGAETMEVADTWTSQSRREVSVPRDARALVGGDDRRRDAEHRDRGEGRGRETDAGAAGLRVHDRGIMAG